MSDGPFLATTKPSFTMPKGSCDTQIHIMGPASKYPFYGDWVTKGYDATEEMASAMHAVLGVEHCVIVHARPHLYDLRVTDAALKAYPDRYRAIALLDPAVEAHDFAAMHDLGYRGVRFNPAGGDTDLELVTSVANQIGGHGWHLTFHMKPDQVVEHADFLATLPVDFVIDHLARVDPTLGVNQPAIAAVKRLLDKGRAWIRLSAFERMAKVAYPHEDILTIASDLMAHAPDRALWATDWPHNLPGPHGVPEDGAMADLIPRFAPTAELQQKLLVENPLKLYDFE